MINAVFQTSIPLDSQLDIPVREAVARALLQAWRVVLRYWKSTDSPPQKWIQCIGETLRLEKYIYQHRGNPRKFPWLDTPGLSPLELVMDRILVA